MRMEHLRAVNYAPSSLFGNSLIPLPLPPYIGDLPTSRLYLLQSLCGDIFPPPHMYSFWEAIGEAKAQKGAAPLLHFGTAVTGAGVKPLARFLQGSGLALLSLQLDVHYIPYSPEGTVDAFRACGLSLAIFKGLRKLAIRIDMPIADSVSIAICAALLATATAEVPLEHLVIAVFYHYNEPSALLRISEQFDELD
ncbi:hypothetical protein PsYK624_122820 [Phanerochaete sordida]|uniref:Uncharacterized protein n=1 Tax=Phanerochaete sordida TaxID=48140 RepID=A0A9P3GKS8_9APHY|nr:hypothetical protein PsYK624_122820 [Phanerochaete sordida]